MKLVKEHINFQRGLDPKAAMGIGSKALIKQWFDKLDIPPENYVINPDLSIDYKYGLYLSNTQITSLPDNLSVNGNLWLDNTPITSLPDNLTVYGHLDLTNTPITSLPDNLRVEGNLWLRNTLITSLPDNLRVEGRIYGFDPKVVKESLEFQRGLDPKIAMGISFVGEIKKVKLLLKAGADIHAYDDEALRDASKKGHTETLKVLEDWLDKEEGLVESYKFRRNLEPKQAMGTGIQLCKQLKLFIEKATDDYGLATVNIEDYKLLLSEYCDVNNFVELFFKYVPKEYFETYYKKTKPIKYKKSWKNDWVFVIKPQYIKEFKSCFDSEGYLKESLNFERGLDPKKAMDIGVFKFDVVYSGQYVDWSKGEEEDAKNWRYKGIQILTVYGSVTDDYTDLYIELSNDDYIEFEYKEFEYQERVSPGCTISVNKGKYMAYGIGNLYLDLLSEKQSIILSILEIYKKRYLESPDVKKF
jgi:hypothetical protein